VKSNPFTVLEVIWIALRSSTVPLFTNPAGSVPFHVMMSYQARYWSVFLQHSTRRPRSDASVPLLTRLLITFKTPEKLTAAVQLVPINSLSAILSQPLVMLSAALLISRRLPHPDRWRQPQRCVADDAVSKREGLKAMSSSQSGVAIVRSPGPNNILNRLKRGPVSFRYSSRLVYPSLSKSPLRSLGHWIRGRERFPRYRASRRRRYPNYQVESQPQ